MWVRDDERGGCGLRFAGCSLWVWRVERSAHCSRPPFRNSGVKPGFQFGTRGDLHNERRSRAAARRAQLLCFCAQLHASQHPNCSRVALRTAKARAHRKHTLTPVHTASMRSGGRPRNRLESGLVATVLALLCSSLVACQALPFGCTASGTELISCSDFQGNSTLDLGGQGLTSIAPQAFASMSTTVTTL